MSARSAGHHFLQIPGPSVVPGRVLRASLSRRSTTAARNSWTSPARF